jgi:dTDP-4-amino-4,6-dideoxygalactose transaminase
MMRSTFLPFAPPEIGEEEIAEVVDTLRSQWLTTGPKVRRFEADFAEFLGAPAALAVNSGTAALHVALAVLGIRRADRVITTPMTFCSSVHVIEHVGARPILVDVEPDTLNIDPALIRDAIVRAETATGQSARNGRRQASHPARVKAILPVHLYGHPCDMDAIHAIAREHDLAIVEDAAHALPARYHGDLIGSAALGLHGSASKTLTAFSFYATKNITTAEGGMLTGPPELVEEARIWSLHGMSCDAYRRYAAAGSWYYEVIRAGFKYNLTDLQAALGLQQLRKLPQFHARRQEIADRYDTVFSEVEEVETPITRPGMHHAWHLYVLRLNLDHLAIDRAQFIEELKARNIGASVHFIPIHHHPYYRAKYGYHADDFPVATREYRRIVSLPLSPRLTDRDVQDVIEAVLHIIQHHRRSVRHRRQAPGQASTPSDHGLVEHAVLSSESRTPAGSGIGSIATR